MPDQMYKGINNDTRVVITAGAGGIGRGIAETFLNLGASVWVCDISEAAIADFTAANPSAGSAQLDIADAEAVAIFVHAAAARMGGIDILVNSAGIAGPTASLEDIGPGEWENTIEVNLNGTFYASRAAIPYLKNNPTASIINIASSAAVMGFPGRAPYTAAKWAMIGLTKTLAMELGHANIRVNAICPGSVSGKRIDDVIEDAAEHRGVDPSVVRQVYLNQVSLKTFVDVEDVANMALFLSSSLGAKISGQVLGIDGHTETLSDPLI